MYLLDELAEQMIAEARDRGDLNDLPGAGHPLPDEDLSLVPVEQRMAYRVLKNAGYIPPALELHREAVAIALQLTTTDKDQHECAALYERLSRINLYLSESGHRQLAVPLEYLDKLAQRL
jgi:IS5 family transposase